MVFGRLTVRSRGENRKWNCVCVCGNAIATQKSNLRSGNTLSCGCLARELLRARKTHGHKCDGRYTPEYIAWCNAIARCTNPNDKNWKNYGARGITVCDKWRYSFVAFLSDVGMKPHKSLSLDRIDNSKGYEPGNCRWATRVEQGRNTRSNRRVSFDGKTLALTEWAECFGVLSDTLRCRIRAGWDIERALTGKSRGVRVIPRRVNR